MPNKNQFKTTVNDDGRICTKCKKFKSWEEFSNTKDGSANNKNSKCKICRKLHHANNSQKYRISSRKSNLKRQYGLTENDYNDLLEKQNNRCAICKTKIPDKRKKFFCIDHNHKNKKIRGLLCNKCNKGLGDFDDSIILLYNAISYLKWQ